MIIDTSALLAILRDEPEAAACARAIEEADVRRLSAVNYLETAVVIDASGDPIASRRLDQLLETAGAVIETVTADQARTGRNAYRDFGRGSGHPARLNFGDCFAYALAVETGEPLLFKGFDFTHTDIEAALPSSGFAAEAHRQSLAAARSDQANQDQDFIAAVSDLRAE